MKTLVRASGHAGLKAVFAPLFAPIFALGLTAGLTLGAAASLQAQEAWPDRKSTRLNSSHT